MEIKCKITFSLPEDLMEALDINDDTPVIASISDGRITVEIVDDEDEYTEDDLYDEDDDDCEDGCEHCEYFCPHCGKCVLN
jgi:antitoxin component of MazEF toxin-antitoxin module